MKTIAEFATEQGIKLEYSKAYSNPNMPDDPGHKMNHWAIKLTNSAGDEFTLHFSKGVGLMIDERGRRVGQPRTVDQQTKWRPEPPTLDEVLDCLASDTSSIDNARDFADWCRELGYDEDIRKAERTYQACIEQAEKFRAFLGSDACEELLYQTERL